jgi:opacity protein-like surface antigen
MNHRLLGTVSLVAASLTFGNSAARAENAYISVFGGYTAPIDSGFDYAGYTYDVRYKDGFSLGAAIGTEISPGLRAELEAAYVRYSANDYTYYGGQTPVDSDVDVEQLFILGNLWKDIHLGSAFSPYFGGGVGVGIASVTASDNPDALDGSGVGLAGQIGGGVRFGLGENLALDLGYRFRGLVDAGIDGDGSGNHAKAAFFSQNVQLGLTYGFGGAARPVADVIDPGSPLYVSVFGGAALPESTGFTLYGYNYDVKNKTGFTLGAAVGVQAAPGLRTELEFSYTDYAAKTYTFDGDGPAGDASGDTQLYMLLANVWKDFHVGGFSPYIGGGIGLGVANSDVVHYNDYGVDDSRIGLGAQFGAGIGYHFTDNLAFDLGYRFKTVLGVTLDGDPDTGASNYGDQMANFYVHTLQAGLTYGFGEGSVVEPAADVSPEGADWYVSVFGGLSLPENTSFAYDSLVYDTRFKNGFTVGAAAGTEILDSIRGELELSYVAYEAKDNTSEGNGDPEPVDGDVGLTFLLANVWKDFDLGMVRPYVGGGIGMALADVDVVINTPDSGVDDTSLGFAGQLGAGAKIAIGDSFDIDFGYRFKAVSEVSLYGIDHSSNANDGDYNGKGSFYTHVFQAGASFNF